MIRNRRNRALTGLVAVAVLVLAACGTRLDHDTIVQAGGAGQAAEGQPLPGEDGGPADFTGPDAEAEDAEAGDSLGDEVEVGADGESGAAGAGSGEAEGGAGRGRGDPARGESRQGSGEPIVIGSVGTYSGPVGASLQQGPRALRAWAAQINAGGGIGGRPVRVVVMDDGGDSSRARSQVQELVEQHKAVAIVNAMSLSAGVKAWRGYLEEKKVPAIGGACVDWPRSPMLFNQCTSLETSAFGVVKVAAEFGKGTKFGGMMCVEDATCKFIEDRWFNKGDAKRAGLDPVYRARISFTQPDFTSECIQARNAGVELLSVMADANTLARVAASCSRQNFTPQYVQLGATVSADSQSQTGLVDNLLVASPVFPFAGLSTDRFRDFDAAWKKHAGGADRGPAAAFGWASAKVFEKAAKEAGKNIDSATLISKLYGYRNERFGGVTVPMTFQEGKGTTDSPCIFVIKAEGGKWKAPLEDKPHCF